MLAKEKRKKESHDTLYADFIMQKRNPAHQAIGHP